MAHKEENLVDYKKGRSYNPSAYGTQDYDNDYYSGQIIPSKLIIEMNIEIQINTRLKL